MYFKNRINLAAGENPDLFEGKSFDGFGRMIFGPQDAALFQGFLAEMSRSGIPCVLMMQESEDLKRIPALDWEKEALQLPIDLFETEDLADLLELRGVQREVLESVCMIAAREHFPLNRIPDLRAVLEEILDDPRTYRHYGNLASVSLSALLRRVIRMEGSFWDCFFGPCIVTEEKVFTRGRDGSAALHRMVLPAGEEVFFRGYVRAFAKKLMQVLSGENETVKLCMVLPAEIMDTEIRDLVRMQEEAQRSGILFCLYGAYPAAYEDPAIRCAAFVLQTAAETEQMLPAQRRSFEAFFRGIPQERLNSLQRDEGLLSIRGQQACVFRMAGRIAFGEVPAGKISAETPLDEAGAERLLSKRRQERDEIRQAVEKEEREKKRRLEEEKSRLREEKEERLEKERQIRERQRKFAPLTRFGNSVISSIGREIGRSLYKSAADFLCGGKKK